VEFPGPYCLLRKKMWRRCSVDYLISLVDLKYSMVDHQSSQTKFPCLPGRFLGKFPNPAVCEEKKVCY
jgi:hypothetical protein